MYNNIIFNNMAVFSHADTMDGDDVYIFDGAGAPVNLFNNDFSDFFSLCENTPGCTPNINEGSNADVDPLFIDAANGDVHLQSGSPIIDAGDPFAPFIPDTDFEGNLRIIGSAPDIGADEFSSFFCGGLIATIAGTPGNDVINGTLGADVINGLGGNDRINGGKGDDVVCGGMGNDIMNGGDGRDILSGMEGRDTISGGRGADQIFGGTGNDTLNGNEGNDRLVGSGGDDTLNGGVNTDTCDGGGGNDAAAMCESTTDIP